MLERKWLALLAPDPALAALVTAQQSAAEPRHRWLHYKQAFSPALVRMFLDATAEWRTEHPGVVLDPFSGAATVPIECARRGVNALGVDALPVMAFLAQSRNAGELPRFPDIAAHDHWKDIAPLLDDDAQRAALIFAAARQHDSDGVPLRDPPHIRIALRDVVQMMRADLAEPPACRVVAQTGDACALDAVPGGSCCALLTSPPYLSRHDYTRTTRPLDRVYRAWFPDADDVAAQRAQQMRAHPRAYARDGVEESELPAVAECVTALRRVGEAKLAGIVRSYFADLAAFLTAARRVLIPSSPCWVVIGGARLRSVYINSDLIFASMAESAGYRVEALRVARDLVPNRRKLGRFGAIAPRETLIELRAAF